MNNQTLKDIVDAAIKAPSGDNVQPWQFQATNDLTCLNLYNLPDRDDSYYNYRQAASYITHGAVIENIIIASQHLGYKANIELFPNQENSNHIAKIQFESTKAIFDPLFAAIYARSTNRFHFRTEEQIPEITIQKLISATQQIDDVKTHITSNPNLIKKLALALMINDRIVFEHEEIHRFLFDKIRWSQEQTNTTLDGMPVDTLGLSVIEKLFFPLMRFWPIVKLSNYVGLSKIIGLKSWYNCNNAGVIGFITVKKADSAGFIQAGRAMQRIWLEGENQGLAFQPIIGLPLLIYRAKYNSLAAFSQKQQHMISTTDNRLRKLFDLQSAEELAVGFRMGKGPKIPVKTLRKPVQLS